MKKILLLHGWDYDNYTARCTEGAWHNRINFVNMLSRSYDTICINFPGFGGTQEPRAKEWDLNDFAYYIEKYIKSNDLKIDYILGYSFGAAVAVRYKSIIDKNIKLILISPAIIRANNNSKNFVKTPRCLDYFRKKLRDLYLIYYIKNPECKYGTTFLRRTYQNIVREDLINEVNKFSFKDILIIYGDKDDMVDPFKASMRLNKNMRETIHFIPDGGHDIANTHTNELINIINENVIS